MTINIVKRNGTKEPLDISKISKVVAWACEDLSSVSQSDVEIQSQLKFYNGMTSADIQETLISAAGELISEETPNYQYVASRLINYHLRKQIYNSPNPTRLYDQVRRVVKAGFYDPLLLEWYSEAEFDLLDSFIDHERDFNIVYAGMEQFRGKYLVKDRTTNKFYETPQMVYILIAAALFSQYPKETRMTWVKNYYDAISKFEISLPTPILAGVRTQQRQFSSCVLIDSGDSIESIISASGAIVKYVANKAGIGINGGRLRARGSKVRNGDVSTTGPIEFWKLFQASVKSVSQGGIRAASATLAFPMWHKDVQEMLVLKNAKGTEYNRVRHLDYSVQLNKLMYERYLTGGNITLFSPNDVPGLYEAFFADQDMFKQLYEAAEKNPKIDKKVVSAKELFDTLILERFETGRVYIMNVDHANNHGSFDACVAPVTMSNLCQEVGIHTKPMRYLDDPNAEIGLCILSAINVGKVKLKDMQRVCALAVRALDALIDYQEYLLPAAANSALNRRTIGIGIVNFAYWMAKNDIKFSDPDYEKIDELVETFAYHITEASVELAEDFGPCAKWKETKYAKGITPNMTYKRDVDQLVSHQERKPWDELRERMRKSGIRNSTLMACMPAETSALLSNSTNGINAITNLVTIKKSKDGILKQVVPDVLRLKNRYESKWDIDAENVIKINAVIHKYIDQYISTNTPYNPTRYEGGEVPQSVLMKDILTAYKYGLATLYYNETNDGSGEIPVEENKSQVEPEDEEINTTECEACIL